ncbi:MAG: hypothetical protein HYR94_18075, partial [Chloroflexi bacterium]|nr:hypothetical protein [Chloroflexota bacterium]
GTRSGGAGEPGSREEIQNVIDLFGKHRLLTFDRDPITRGPTVEVAHEALLREWGRLREWLDASRADIRLQRLLASAAAEWIEANQDEGFLLRRARLDQFAGWAASTQLALTQDERAFLEASLAARQARRAEEEARQRRELETAQKLAETESQRAQEQTRAARRLRWLAVGLAVFQRYLGHSDDVRMVDFSPDGRYVLTASADRTARLWNAQTGQEVRQFNGHTAQVNAAIFSPDGRSILTGGLDNTARLWDTETGQEVRQFNGHTGGVWGIAFTPDGHQIITSDSTLARLWDAQTGEVVRQFSGHTGTIFWLDLSPDGRYLATFSGDKTARLWDVQTGQELRQFVGHTDWIGGGRLSADDRYLLTTSGDQTTRLWDIQTGREMRRFVGHTDDLFDGIFSPDGNYVLTGSDDNTARLWDTHSGAEVRPFIGHTGAVLDAAFSQDGRFILTGSADTTARRWAVDTGQELQKFVGHTEQVSRVAFSPDGRSVLTASTDQTARLWDAETGQETRRLVGHTSPILFVDFSADGRSVRTGDTRISYLWRTKLEDVIEFTCTQLSRDFTEEEQARYNITDTAPTCPKLATQRVEVEPTWTPVPPGSVKEVPLTLTFDMEFLSEEANIRLGLPVQDAFIDAGNGQVVRPTVLNEETLALPVYRTAAETELDFFEAPFDTGPYPKGEPLGFTLEDYVTATGYGTYTVQGDRAAVEITFDHLVPKGLYTLWCVTLFFSTASMSEYPCLAPDGSMYSFTADETGHADISMDIAAFPPSTKDTVYEIGIAYHSDGQTHGFSVGEHGLNAHGQMIYDFLPPEGIPGPLAPQSRVAEDDSVVAREWMQLLVERVQADKLSPPVATRIYAYAGVTLYEAVVPGMSNYKSLQGQLNDMPELPEPEGGPYNWPAVAASAAAIVAQALFESPTSQAAFEQLRDQQLAALWESGVASDILKRSRTHGQNLGQAIVTWMETDGYDELRTKPYTSPTGPGSWVSTSVSRIKPVAPYWGDLRPFALTAADACKPPDPVAYSEEPGSAFYAQAREVYDTSQTLTAEQKAIALFWSDSPGMTRTPPGHWVSIVNQISEEQQLPLDKTAELHALVGIGLAGRLSSDRYHSPIPLM